MEAASAVHTSALRVEDTPKTRLAPLTRSWNPLVWLALAVYRWGAVSTTPVRVLFARAPRLILSHVFLMIGYAYGTSLSHRLRSLVSVYGSRINGCMFCDDLETATALKSKALVCEDVDALPEYRTSARFSPRERAALGYVEELNTTRRASDETFETLRQHFSEKEIVELTWINAVGNYLNLLAKPLGLESEGACAIPQRAPRG